MGAVVLYLFEFLTSRNQINSWKKRMDLCCAISAGVPQRVTGKMSCMVTVGSTSVELNDIDLHAYIVVGDGRAYTAISEVETCIYY